MAETKIIREVDNKTVVPAVDSDTRFRNQLYYKRVAFLLFWLSPQLVSFYAGFANHALIIKLMDIAWNGLIRYGFFAVLGSIPAILGSLLVLLAATMVASVLWCGREFLATHIIGLYIMIGVGVVLAFLILLTQCTCCQNCLIIDFGRQLGQTLTRRLRKFYSIIFGTLLGLYVFSCAGIVFNYINAWKTYDHCAVELEQAFLFKMHTCYKVLQVSNLHIEHVDALTEYSCDAMLFTVNSTVTTIPQEMAFNLAKRQVGQIEYSPFGQVWTWSSEMIIALSGRTSPLSSWNNATAVLTNGVIFYAIPTFLRWRFPPAFTFPDANIWFNIGFEFFLCNLVSYFIVIGIGVGRGMFGVLDFVHRLVRHPMGMSLWTALISDPFFA